MVNGVIVAMTDAEITEFNSQITKNRGRRSR